MAILSGKWTLRAIGKEAGWVQGVRISGSLAHDGPHVLDVGDEIVGVEGEKIVVTLAAVDPAFNTWVDSLEQQQAAWDDAIGLTVTLFADDNPPNGDLDFNDLVVFCEPLEGDFVSPHAGQQRPDLSIPVELVAY